MTGTGRRVVSRRIFAAIVDCFGYRTTRKEWVRALCELQQAGQLTMEGQKILLSCAMERALIASGFGAKF
jgi:hypothetical protein